MNHNRELIWRRSRKSTSEGQCVEVAGAGGAVLVRDSKNPSGPMLALSQAGARSLVFGLRQR